MQARPSASRVPLEEYLKASYPEGDREYLEERIVERNVGEFDRSEVQTAAAVYLRNHYGGCFGWEWKSGFRSRLSDFGFRT